MVQSRVGEEERFGRGRAREIDERARTNQLSSERRNRFGTLTREKSIWEHDERRKRLTREKSIWELS
jgi:hypothetical protein